MDEGGADASCLGRAVEEDGAGLDGKGRCARFLCPARDEEDGPGDGRMDAMAGEDIVK